MRIAMISYHTCPLAAQEGKETGGMNIYVLELSKALVKLGHQVDIYTRIQDTISPEIVDFQPGLRIIHLAAGPKRSIDKKSLIRYIDKFSDKLFRYIQNNKINYDIFHAHYYQSGMIALKLKKLNHFSQPLVTTFHTLALMKNLVARSVEEQESNERILAERQLINKSNCITASSEMDYQYLISLYNCPPEKISVVYPGVDTAIFHPIQRNIALQYIESVTHDNIALFVGRIEPLKGIDVLMHAIKILGSRKQALKICLLVVGSREDNFGHEQEELIRLKKLQKTLGISPIVGFISQRHQHELPYYYNAASVVVMPSYYESFGMAALEAMACKTPVIITNTSGISALFSKDLNSLIVSVNNPLQLADQIENAIVNEKFRRKYKMRVQQLIKHLTWEETAKKTQAVYKRILFHE